MIFSVTLPPNLEHMNVFQISTNKKYFDQGKINYQLEHTILKSINTGINFLSQKISSESNLDVYIEGPILSWIEKNSKETLSNLKKFAKSRFVNLVAGTYFNSSPKTLTQEELNYQIEEHKNKLKNIFGRTPKTLMLTSEINQEIIKKHSFKNSIYTPKLKDGIFNGIKIITNNFFINKSEELLEDDWLNLNSKQIEPHSCDLTNHLNEQTKNIYSAIKMGGDVAIMNDWRNLSSNLNKLDVDYETYMSTMNVLNDITHKIKNITLLKNGKELQPLNLTDNPSSELKQFLENEVSPW